MSTCTVPKNENIAVFKRLVLITKINRGENVPDFRARVGRHRNKSLSISTLKAIKRSLYD